MKDQELQAVEEEPPPKEPPSAGFLDVFCHWCRVLIASSIGPNCHSFKKTNPGIGIYLPNISIWRDNHN